MCCVGSGICDGLITGSEDSYRVSLCLIMCDLVISTVRRPRTKLGCCTTGKKNRTGISETVKIIFGIRFAGLYLSTRN